LLAAKDESTGCLKNVSPIAGCPSNRHVICEDYNNRSRRMWEKYGFTKILEESIPDSWKGKMQYHYRLTRQDFIERKKLKAPENDSNQIREEISTRFLLSVFRGTKF
jgi:hypothetical protein